MAEFTRAPENNHISSFSRIFAEAEFWSSFPPLHPRATDFSWGTELFCPQVGFIAIIKKTNICCEMS
jgi:hypothetical protein